MSLYPDAEKICLLPAWVLLGFFVVLISVVAAGCIGPDYVPNHDIVLIKVTPTGTLEWSKIFDSGKDDIVISFFQTSDGGYAMIGGMEYRLGMYHSYLIKFSDIGNEQWNRTLDQSNCGEEFLTQDSDGHLLTYPSSTGIGEMCKFNLQGDLVWKGTSLVVENGSKNRLGDQFYGVEKICIQSIDGGSFCAELQSDIVGRRINPFEGDKTEIIAKKLDKDGIQMWERSVTKFCKPKNFDSNILLKRIIQTSEGGYVILGSRDNFWKC